MPQLRLAVIPPYSSWGARAEPARRSDAINVSYPKEPAMCVSLTLKIFSATLFFQGCASIEPVSLPQRVEPPPVPPIKSEFWAPMVAKADPDPEDGSVTVLFRDADADLVRAAIAACG